MECRKELCMVYKLIFSLPLFLWPTFILAQLPSYLQREVQVKEIYQKYLDRFQKDFKLLQERLKTDAPQLLETLAAFEPKKIKIGYQVLPEIKKDFVRMSQESKPIAGEVYSWPLTETYIKAQTPILEEMEEKLKIMPKIPLEKRKNIYRKMIDETLTMQEDQKTMDGHIRYNSFWQKVIFEDKPRFDEMTKMYDLVLGRQALLDQIKNRENPYLLNDLKKQAQVILEKIHQAIYHQMKRAAFVKITHKANAWVIQVPLYTDIEDQHFLKNFKSIIEKKWSLEPFKLNLVIKRIRKDASFPKPGDPVDINKHIKHFPTDGGVLTTGAEITYSASQTYTQLGPEDITENALAHEFGHILGFPDGYFRGYHDLGKDGFEVMEIIADPDDIMSSPTIGKVQQHHFEQLHRDQNWY